MLFRSSVATKKVVWQFTNLCANIPHSGRSPNISRPPARKYKWSKTKSDTGDGTMFVFLLLLCTTHRVASSGRGCHITSQCYRKYHHLPIMLPLSLKSSIYLLCSWLYNGVITWHCLGPPWITHREITAIAARLIRLLIMTSPPPCLEHPCN